MFISESVQLLAQRSSVPSFHRTWSANSIFRAMSICAPIGRGSGRRPSHARAGGHAGYWRQAKHHCVHLRPHPPKSNGMTTTPTGTSLARHCSMPVYYRARGCNRLSQRGLHHRQTLPRPSWRSSLPSTISAPKISAISSRLSDRRHHHVRDHRNLPPAVRLNRRACAFAHANAAGEADDRVLIGPSPITCHRVARDLLSVENAIRPLHWQ